MDSQFQLPISTHLPKFGKSKLCTPREVAQRWLSEFENILVNENISGLDSVFHEECWWRDALALSWDYHTLHSLIKVKSFLERRLSSIGFVNLKLREQGFCTPNQATITENLQWVESVFTFQTYFGRGQGVLRLTPDEEGSWKAYIVYTSTQELIGHEWAIGTNRPHGGKNTLEGGIIMGNWYERRQRQKEFMDEEPTCLIIGAGMNFTMS